jgi:hypothetical protein
MPDEDLEFALTSPEAFRVASVSGKVTVWAEVDGMLVRAQRRGDGSWLAASLTFKETEQGTAMMGYLMLPAVARACRTLNSIVSQLEEQMGANFDQRLTLARK